MIDLVKLSIKDICFFVIDRKGYITNWDDSAAKIIGYARSDIIGKHFSVLFTSDDLRKKVPEKEIKEAFANVLSTRERQCVRMDSSHFMALCITHVIKDENGKVTGFMKVVRDINEQKLTFDALHKSEEQFRMLVEDIRDYAVIMLDVRGYITTWNKGVEYIFGYSQADILGKSFKMLHPKEYVDKGESDRELKEALVNSRAEREGWRLRADGSLFWANEIVNAVRNKQKRLIGFVKIIKDTTEAKKSREMLKKYTRDLELTQKTLEMENAEDEALLESIGEGVVATNADAIVVLINKQAQMMLGVTEEEALGKTCTDIWTVYDNKGDRIPSHSCLVPTVLRSGKRLVNSNYYFASGRKYFPAAATTTPIILDGATIGTVTVIRDVTKEKEIERAKSEFVSLASHQLRTPLTAIKLFVEMLMSGSMGNLGGEQMDVLNNIEQSNEKMIQLVDNLLNVSRIETGKMKIKLSTTNLHEFIKNCIKEAIPLAAASKGKILFKYKKSDHLTIETDPNLMRQVMNNLLMNAIQYSPKHAKVWVTLDTNKDGEIIINVTDNGIGIPRESREKIFERFYRADNALKTKTDGTGLGLYMCKLFLEALGGKIWCEPRKGGHGASFYVALNSKGRESRDDNKTTAKKNNITSLQANKYNYAPKI